MAKDCVRFYLWLEELSRWNKERDVTPMLFYIKTCGLALPLEGFSCSRPLLVANALAGNTVMIVSAPSRQEKIRKGCATWISISGGTSQQRVQINFALNRSRPYEPVASRYLLVYCGWCLLDIFDVPCGSSEGSAKTLTKLS
jgi:hypothetical protein